MALGTKRLSAFCLLFILACLLYSGLLTWKKTYFTDDGQIAKYLFFNKSKQPSPASSDFTYGKLTNETMMTPIASTTEIIHCKNVTGTYNSRMVNEHFDETTIRRHPNFPSILLKRSRLSVSLPDIPRIRWGSSLYQESWIGTPKFLLYSAHFDARPKDGLVIRLVVLYEGYVPLPAIPKYYCQVWHNQTESPSVVPVVDAHLLFKIDYHKNHLTPYILSCKIPPPLDTPPKLPIVVSLVKAPCETPTNVLQIAGSPVKKRRKTNVGEDIDVAVCSKAIYYYNTDFSTRLIEWIEFMRSLGVSKIHLYKMACHENVSKVLDYYEKEGFLQIFSFHFAPPMIPEGTFFRSYAKGVGSPLQHTFKTDVNDRLYHISQSTYLDDCILRNHDKHDYIGYWDFDEVPVLRSHATLKDFIKSVKSSHPNETSRRSIYLDWKVHYQNIDPGPSVGNISKRFYILTHNRRTQLTSRTVYEDNGKCIHDTKHIFSAYVHTPHRFVNSETKNFLKIENKVAYMAHFGDKEIILDRRKKRKIGEENALLKFKDGVMSRAMAVFKKLEL